MRFIQNYTSKNLSVASNDSILGIKGLNIINKGATDSSTIEIHLTIYIRSFQLEAEKFQ